MSLQSSCTSRQPLSIGRRWFRAKSDALPPHARRALAPTASAVAHQNHNLICVRISDIILDTKGCHRCSRCEHNECSPRMLLRRSCDSLPEDRHERSVEGGGARCMLRSDGQEMSSAHRTSCPYCGRPFNLGVRTAAPGPGGERGSLRAATLVKALRASSAALRPSG